MKSSKSRTPDPGPRGWKSDQRLKPRTQGSDREIMRTMLMRTLLRRVHPLRFMPKAMMFSKTAMTVDSAAKERKMKKSMPQICPPGIFTKRFGMVRKIRIGPASGLMP